MGLFSGAKQRRQAREQRVYDDRYNKALSEGKSPDEASAAAERAVRRRRRIRRAAVITAAGK